jgi:hypothetical protein
MPWNDVFLWSDSLDAASRSGPLSEGISLTQSKGNKHTPYGVHLSDAVTTNSGVELVACSMH